MTLKKLESIFELRSEINLLTARMKKYYARGDYVGDYGYNANRAAPFTIQGVAAYDEPKLERLKERCRRRVLELDTKISEATAFIETIPDATVRVLLEARVVDGLTWDEAARMLYKKMSADSARMIVNRFFDEK